MMATKNTIAAVAAFLAAQCGAGNLDIEKTTVRPDRPVQQTISQAEESHAVEGIASASDRKEKHK